MIPKLGELVYVSWHSKPIRNLNRGVGWVVHIDENELILANTFAMQPLPTLRVPVGFIRKCVVIPEP